MVDVVSLARLQLILDTHEQRDAFSVFVFSAVDVDGKIAPRFRMLPVIRDNHHTDVPEARAFDRVDSYRA